MITLRNDFLSIKYRKIRLKLEVAHQNYPSGRLNFRDALRRIYALSRIID